MLAVEVRKMAREEIESVKTIRDVDVIKQLLYAGKQKLLTLQYNQVMAR